MSSTPPTPGRRALRAIAGFEAFKAVLAIAAGLGLLGLLNHDLHHLAASLISHVGLDPGSHYPALVLGDIDRFQAAPKGALELAVWAYALVRATEAWGLWREQPWGAWLGGLSGLLYMPFELRHLVRQPGPGGVALLALNLAVVAFLGWRLQQQAGVPRAAADSDYGSEPEVGPLGYGGFSTGSPPRWPGDSPHRAR